jgi:hypothetical protein
MTQCQGVNKRANSPEKTDFALRPRLLAGSFAASVLLLGLSAITPAQHARETDKFGRCDCPEFRQLARFHHSSVALALYFQ